MALVPTEWIAPLAFIVVLLIADQVRFGGKHTKKLLAAVMGNSFERVTVEGGVKFRGREIVDAELQGYSKRGDKDVERWGVRYADGKLQCFDEDEVRIPFRAVTKYRTEGVDIEFVDSRLKVYQDEIDVLNTRLQAITAKANLAFQNSMDFTTTMTSNVGEWKKNIGSTVMLAQKTKEGYGYQQEQQRQEMTAAEG